MNKFNEGLERYIESCSIPNHLIKEADVEVIRESMSKIPSKIVESIRSADPKGWWVPISHYGNYVNGNGRIYNTKLWENVINNQKDAYIGSPMLNDHPQGDSDGNPSDICGVWLDCKLGKANQDGIGIVYGLLVPSGRNGRDLQDHLQNGLKIGTSSSGFGKLMRDGKTVDPDTYHIERLADFVLNPSQGTFFSWDESNSEIEDKIIEEYNESTEGSFNNIIENNNIKEKVVKDSKFTKLEEKKFRRDMESFLESANNIKDPQERLEEFKEIKSYLEEGACPDLKEKVEAKIVEQEAEIKKMLEDSITLKEELGIKSTRDLKEKLTRVVEDTKLAEREAKDWKSISEQLQEKLTEANKTLEERPTIEFTDYQRNKINSLSEKMKSHDDKASQLIKELAEAYKKIKESCDSMKEQIKGLEEENAELQKQLESECCGKDCAEKEKSDLEEKCSQLEKDLKESKNKISKYNKLFAQQRNQLEESVGYLKNMKALKEKADNQINSLAKEAKSAQMKIRKDALKKVQEQRNNLTETERYYEELYNLYGNEVRAFKEKIVNARSIGLAKNVFIKDVLPNLNESKKLQEMRKPYQLYSKETDQYNEDYKCAMNESAVDRLPKGWK